MTTTQTTAAYHAGQAAYHAGTPYDAIPRDQLTGWRAAATQAADAAHQARLATTTTPPSAS